MAKKLRVIGKTVRDISAFDKLTGKAKFNNDIKYDGMLHAKLIKSPHAKAKVISIDTSLAEKVDGVKLIMTNEKFPKLFYKKLNFIGQDVACVVAKDYNTACKAARLVKVEYEVMPSVIDPYEAKKEGSVIAMHDKDSNILPYENYKFFKDPDDRGLFKTQLTNETDFDGYGDIDEEKKNVDIFVRGKDYKHAKAQAPLMATSGCVANFRNGKLTVHIPCQYATVTQVFVAQFFGLPISKVNVVSICTGGGFGGRLSQGVGTPENEATYTFVAAAAAIELGEPVRLFYSRQEEFYYLWGRSGMDTKTEIGFKKDGTIVTMDTEVWRNISTAGYWGLSTLGFDATATGNMLYAHNCKANRHRKLGVTTNGPVFVGWQGFGNPEVFFAIESTMDIAAEELGMDPIELRRKNHMREGDNFLELFYNWTGPHYLGHTGITDCLDEGMKKVNWENRIPPSEKTGVIRHGLGMALHSQQNGGEGLSSNAIVKLHSDGTVVFVCNYQDIGQSGRTAQIQHVSEVLGVDMDKITIVADETEHTYYTHYQSCSSGTFVCSNTTYKAANAARIQLLELASKAMGVPADQLDTANGIIFKKGESADKGIPWIAAFMQRDNVKFFMGDVIVGHGHFVVGPGPMPSEQGATFVDLDVDTETGRLENIKVTLCQDCGRAISPRVVEAHYLGVHHGLEALTSAEQILDMKTGKLLNDNYIDYGVSSILDYNVKPVVIENPDPGTPYGAVGIGQAFQNGLAAAVSNAIYNAIGVRMKETPFTPARILKALGKI